MLDALKTLFENDVVSEEVRRDIEEAWNAKVKENRLEATAELREEFAKKYEHDKETMVEAIDSMLTEKLAEEIAEFHMIITKRSIGLSTSQISEFILQMINLILFSVRTIKKRIL